MNKSKFEKALSKFLESTEDRESLIKQLDPFFYKKCGKSNENKRKTRRIKEGSGEKSS
jgi:hypothetical protein